MNTLAEREIKEFLAIKFVFEIRFIASMLLKEYNYQCALPNFISNLNPRQKLLITELYNFVQLGILTEIRERRYKPSQNTD